MTGVPPGQLDEQDLVRELAHLHETRHETFLHGSKDALDHHTERMFELENEYRRRHPDEAPDPTRTREGRQ